MTFSITSLRDRTDLHFTYMAKDKTYIEIVGLDGFFACDDGWIYDGGGRVEKFKSGWRNAVTINGKDYFVDELIYKAFHGEIPENHFIWHNCRNDRPTSLELKSFDTYNKEKEVKQLQDMIYTLADIHKEYITNINRLQALTQRYEEVTKMIINLDENHPLMELAQMVIHRRQEASKTS